MRSSTRSRLQCARSWDRGPKIMGLRRKFVHYRQSGFTLLEMLIVLAILGLVVGAVFSQMDVAQQRMTTEGVKLDYFQEARDFVDQFFRDINQIGDPNVRLADTTSPLWSPALTLQTTYPWASPYINDNRFAMGLVKIDNAYLQFEGSVNGVGNVESVIYAVNGSGSCTLCLQRSQVDKVAADPLTGQATNWGTEVNDVQTTVIFKYYQTDGTQVTTLPLDYTTQANAQILANIKTIQINLTIRNPGVVDPKTKLPIETTFEGEVSLNNCSMAATAQGMSC
jgi:prepilin-type N-terminal cleavage/methylation domain-containing protein